MQPTDGIPLTVITGFLGAGKTSWLNRRIRDGLAPRSLILVNDFGSINIDAELIEYRDDRILRLANGCICCSLGGTLADQLAQVRRLDPRPGALLIEASGVADPAKIADIAQVSRHFILAGIDCLVDASQIERYSKSRLTGDIWHRQIETADRLLINRLPPDIASAQALRARLAELNPQACQVVLPPVDVRSGSLARAAPQPVPADAVPGQWRSVNLVFEGPVDAGQLEALFSEYGDVLLRAKGILGRCDRPGLQVLQLSGSSLSWMPARPGLRGHQLVCIGASGARFDDLVTQLCQLATEVVDDQDRSNVEDA